jgi:peptide chain release factor subunit 1
MTIAMPGCMAKSTIALATPLREQLDRLAAFEPIDNAPVLSLYLDMRPDQHGRDNYTTFLRKTFAERSRTLQGEARKSFEHDAERITGYLDQQLRKSANGLAIFACAARDEFFEAVQLDASTDGHWLFIGSVPHLYPLARVNDQFPRYAALLVNTNSARLFVFGLGATELTRQVVSPKTRRTMMGGWSQARYQRHVENFHLHHMKEVVDVLDRVVRKESIGRIVIACDDTARATLFEQLPGHLKNLVVDTMALDINTPEHQVLSDTLAVMREHDAHTDADRVAAMLDAWRAHGLAVAGPEETLQALAQGQVEELLITAVPDLIRNTSVLPPDAAPGPLDVDTSAPATGLDQDRLKLSGELVARAQRTSARIRFIEDPALLARVGGVGAILRFRI